MATSNVSSANTKLGLEAWKAIEAQADKTQNVTKDQLDALKKTLTSDGFDISDSSSLGQQISKLESAIDEGTANAGATATSNKD